MRLALKTFRRDSRLRIPKKATRFLSCSNGPLPRRIVMRPVFGLLVRSALPASFLAQSRAGRERKKTMTSIDIITIINTIAQVLSAIAQIFLAIRQGR